MKLFEKKNFIKIEKEDLKDARLSSADFGDERIQKRAFANVLGARLAIKMLFSRKIEANNVYSLYTIQNVLKDLDIADIYYSDIKIDIRLIFNREEIFIPKSHLECELLPDLYLVLELSSDLSGAEFLGFFDPEKLNKENANNEFYFINESELQLPDNIKKFLNEFTPKSKKIVSTQDLEKSEEFFLSSTDDEISKEDKIFLLKQLSNSILLREKFVEFENFELISKKVAQNAEIFEDSVLDIIGAQQVLEGEDKNQTKQEVKSEIIEEVLTDLINPDEIESIGGNEETEEILTDFSIDDDEFLDELKESKKDDSKIGSAIIGTAAGAVAGAIAGAAAASAATGMMAGVEAQESIINSGINAATAGLNLAESTIQAAADMFPEPAKQMKDAVDFDEVEIIEDDSFFPETESEASEFLNDLDEDNVLDIDMDNLNNLEENDSYDDLSEPDAIEFSEEIVDTNEVTTFEEIENVFEDEDFVQEESVELPDFEIEDLDKNEDNEEISDLGETELFELSEDFEKPEVSEEVEELAEFDEPEESEGKEDFESFENIDEDDESVEAENALETETDIENAAEAENKAETITDLKDLENEKLFNNLPELDIDFDNIEPDYLKNFQQEDSEPVFAQQEEITLNEDMSKVEDDLQGEVLELNLVDEVSDNYSDEPAENENINEEEDVVKFEDFAMESEFETGLSETVSSEDSDNFISEDNFSSENDDDFEIEEKTDTENISTDNDDSVISEVDNFLKNVNFTEESDLVSDDEIDNIDLNFLTPNENTQDEEISKDSVEDSDLEIIDKSVENPSEKNDSIQMLFDNENDDINIAKLFPTGQKIIDYAKKDKRVIVAASVAGVMLISLIAGGVSVSNKNANQPQQQEMEASQRPPMPENMDMGNRPTPDMPQDMNMEAQNPTAPIDSNISPQTQNEMQSQINKDMSQAASDAFLSEPVNATITKVAWEVPEELAYNDGFRKYLQMTGKNIKLNLQNDLLLASDMAYSNKVVVDLRIGKDGHLQSSDIISSSGSKQIDRLVLQSVKRTLQYLKMPADELSGDSADVTLIINF